MVIKVKNSFKKNLGPPIAQNTNRLAARGRRSPNPGLKDPPKRSLRVGHPVKRQIDPMPSSFEFFIKIGFFAKLTSRL